MNSQEMGRESKRANSLLRHPDDDECPLNTIYMANGEGEISPNFPQTLGELFRLNGMYYILAVRRPDIWKLTYALTSGAAQDASKRLWTYG